MKKNDVLFTVGTPYAGWTDLARALLGGPLAMPEFSRWLDDVLRDAPTEQARTAYAGGAIAPTPARISPLQSLFAGRGDVAGGCDPRGVWVLDLLDAAVPAACYLIWIESPATMLARQLAQRDDGDPRRWLATWCTGTERLLRLAQRRPERCLLVVAQEAALRPAAVAHRVADRFGITLELPPPLPAVAIDPVAHALADLMVRSDPAAAALLEEVLASCTPLGDEPADLRLTAQDAIASISGLRALRKAATAAAAPPPPAAKPAPVPPPTAAIPVPAKAAAKPAASDTPLPPSGQPLAGESDLLLEQIEQLQRELIDAHRQATRKATAGTAVAAKASAQRAWPPQLSAERLVLQGFRDKGPFRELNAVLRKLEFGGRKAPELMLRLVEHHGRAGIAVFDPAGGASILEAQPASGQEAGRSYHLIVPADAAHRDRLATWSATDWLLLRALVERFGDVLKAARPMRSRWVAIAGRLLQELDALPARLRCDGVQASAGEAVDGDPVVLLQLRSASCAGRSAPVLHLRWRLPADPGRGIERSAIDLVRAPEGHEEAWLPCWPIADGGSAAPALPLSAPDGSVAPAIAGAHEADRAFLIGLLRGLPRAVAALPEGALPAGWSAAALARASESLPATVAARWAPPRSWKDVARALAGRRLPGGQ